MELTRAQDPDIPDYDTWKQMGLFRKYAGPVVPLADFRKGPQATPMTTPSGKIEIYSDRLARMAEKWTFGDFRPKLRGDVLKPLPEYVETWEGQLEARESDKYPLQIIGHHFKARTLHLRQCRLAARSASPDAVDQPDRRAGARHQQLGDQVFVFNDRGTVRIEAKVTPRIAPGVLSLPQGAWYQPTGGARPAGAQRWPPRRHRRFGQLVDVAASFAAGQGQRGPHHHRSG